VREAAGVEAVIGGGAVRDAGAGSGGLGRGVRRVDDVVSGAVLVDDVVGVDRDEHHGADLEGVEVAPQAVAVPVGHAVVRQQEPAQVVAEAVRAVPVVSRRALRRDAAGSMAGVAGDRVGAELGLVVAEGRHPGPVRGAARDVVAEVPPHARRVVHVEVGVAQVAVEQVEQRRALAVARVLDRGDRVPGVIAGLVPDVARGVEIPGRRGQVAVAGEPELRPPGRRGLERRARHRRLRRAVGDLVVVARSRLQALELHVVAVGGLPVQRVGEADRGSFPVPLRHVERPGVRQLDQPAGIARRDRLGRHRQDRRGLRHRPGGAPGHRDIPRRVRPPGQQQLLRLSRGGERHRGRRRPARRSGGCRPRRADDRPAQRRRRAHPGGPDDEPAPGKSGFAVRPAWA